ncbi:MAG TPA: rRNA maturation RNase YbeY [Thermomicrobiales bacterium]|nr:rRNA maturation RNase YbeY [Thermomicrobiales bacterium]
MHDVELVVDRDDVPELPVTDEELQGLLTHALHQTRPESEESWQVSILFTTDERIQAMHAEFMGIDTPTDIMTFPYEVEDYLPAEFTVAGGDLVISVETAAANAAEVGWSTADELRYLVLHGLLHLLGWNDTSGEEREAMLLKQDALMASWRDLK